MGCTPVELVQTTFGTYDYPKPGFSLARWKWKMSRVMGEDPGKYCDAPDVVNLSEEEGTSGAQLYSCDQCGRRFSQRDSLAMHAALHKGDKPYFCKICNMKFVLWNDLCIHVGTHTGKNPVLAKSPVMEYKCEECGRTFWHKGSFMRHKNKHKDLSQGCADEGMSIGPDILRQVLSGGCADEGLSTGQDIFSRAVDGGGTRNLSDKERERRLQKMRELMTTTNRGGSTITTKLGGSMTTANLGGSMTTANFGGFMTTTNLRKKMTPEEREERLNKLRQARSQKQIREMYEQIEKAEKRASLAEWRAVRAERRAASRMQAEQSGEVKVKRTLAERRAADAEKKAAARLKAADTSGKVKRKVGRPRKTSNLPSLRKAKELELKMLEAKSILRDDWTEPPPPKVAEKTSDGESSDAGGDTSFDLTASAFSDAEAHDEVESTENEAVSLSPKEMPLIKLEPSVTVEEISAFEMIPSTVKEKHLDITMPVLEREQELATEAVPSEVRVSAKPVIMAKKKSKQVVDGDKTTRKPKKKRKRVQPTVSKWKLTNVRESPRWKEGPKEKPPQRESPEERRKRLIQQREATIRMRTKETPKEKEERERQEERRRIKLEMGRKRAEEKRAERIAEELARKANPGVRRGRPKKVKMGRKPLPKEERARRKKEQKRNSRLKRLANETPEERKARLEKLRVSRAAYKAKLLEDETPEERIKRLERMRKYWAECLAKEMEAQREKRLAEKWEYEERKKAQERLEVFIKEEGKEGQSGGKVVDGDKTRGSPDEEHEPSQQWMTESEVTTNPGESSGCQEVCLPTPNENPSLKEYLEQRQQSLIKQQEAVIQMTAETAEEKEEREEKADKIWKMAQEMSAENTAAELTGQVNTGEKLGRPNEVKTDSKPLSNEEKEHGKQEREKINRMKSYANETDEQREQRRKESMRISRAKYLAKETPEQRKRRLEKLRINHAKYKARILANETPEERSRRLQRMRTNLTKYHAKRIAKETPEEKNERLERMRMNRARCLAKETAEKREKRLAERREYRARKRAQDKLEVLLKEGKKCKSVGKDLVNDLGTTL